MCLTHNQPNHFGSLKSGLAADPLKATIRVVRRHHFLVSFQSGLGLCESSPDFSEICLFLLDLTKIEEILVDLNEIRPNLEKISPDLNRSDKIRPANHSRKLFLVVFWSGRLKISFPCSNSSVDSPVLGFGSEDPPPTDTDVRLAGSRARSARLGG